LLDHFINYSPSKLVLTEKIQRVKGNQPIPFDSWFEVDVYNDIVSKGYGVIPQYEVVKERYRIDLVVLLRSGVKIAIECDGDKFHGPEEFQSDLNRQKTLERCGWQFFRVRGSEYYSNRIEAMKDLWPILEQSND
jgi:very-short-patch-repair endonuclease